MLALSPLKVLALLAPLISHLFHFKKLEHVAMILKTTHSLPGKLLGDEIDTKLLAENRARLVGDVFHYTAGVPRYVLEVLNGVIRQLRESVGTVAFEDLTLQCDTHSPELTTKSMVKLYRFLGFCGAS